MTSRAADGSSNLAPTKDPALFGSQGDPVVRVSLGAQANLPADLAAYVEELGLGLDSAGLPRAAGRMFAWLLVCDPPEQSAEDLADALSASTGGVSTNARLLMRFGFVERVGRAGERRTYYRVAPSAWEAVMVVQQADTTRFKDLGRRGLDLLADAAPARRARLAEMTDFYAFLEREMPALLRRYHKQKGTIHE